jgi:hypothetical protein
MRPRYITATVADVFNNGEIVGNKQVRKAEIALQTIIKLSTCA